MKLNDIIPKELSCEKDLKYIFYPIKNYRKMLHLQEETADKRLLIYAETIYCDLIVLDS